MGCLEFKARSKLYSPGGKGREGVLEQMSFGSRMDMTRDNRPSRQIPD